METIKFKTNINCSGCVMKVESFLNAEKAIKKWEVNTNDPQKILSTEIELSDIETVIKAVKKAGYAIERI